MEVYIVRHGKTDWNKEGKFQGAHDIPLNEEGRAAAVKLAEHLKDVHFDEIFSSPLSRAYETACIVANKGSLSLSKGVTKNELLKEISFGEFEGVPFNKWMDTDEPRKYFFDEPAKYVPPKGGETFESGCERTAEFVHTVLEPYYKKNPNARIMIVAHGAILAALMCGLENRGIEHFWGNGLKGNCEETIYKYDGQKWTLESEQKPQENPYMKMAGAGEGNGENAEGARILPKSDPASVETAAKIMKDGGVVIIPTDTVYGFSGIVGNHSDDRIRAIKGRAETKPLIQLIACPEDLEKYTDDKIPPALLEKWPGALTIIVNTKKGGADSAGTTVAFRCPGDQWLRKVINLCDCPIYSTSVNRSGQPVLDTQNSIISEFQKEVDLIITDGDKKGALPSTLVSIADGDVKVLRQGAVEL